MTEGNKKRDAPAGAHNSQAKRKKTGNGGKWKTAHQESKAGLSRSDYPRPGDTGIWVSCARGQENKAAREVVMIFEEYAKLLYDVSPPGDVVGEDGVVDDIEAAIKKEVAAMGAQKNGSDESIIKPLRVDVECLLFVRTKPPIDPVQFAKRICVDAKTSTGTTKIQSRYLNRLTPVTASAKATEQDLVEVARSVLTPFFDLSGKRESTGAKPAEGHSSSSGGDCLEPSEISKEGQDHPTPSEVPGLEPGKPAEAVSYSFAIRPTIRTHTTLKRDVVINLVAGLINNDRHKVDLGSPDKVILVDIYKNICCMSVVDGDWDELKRYNLMELYGLAKESDGAQL